MYRVLAMLAAMATASSCASAPPTLAQIAARNVRANPAFASCPAGLQTLDFANLPAVDLSAYGEDVHSDHARVRGPNHGFPDTTDAQVILRMYAGGDPHQQVYTEISSVVWKDAAGVWRAHAVHYRPNYFPPPRPPGEPQYTREEYEDLRRDITSGQLSAEQAEMLDRTLADPCLELQPDVVPVDAPDRCVGGFSGGTIEITRAGVTRRISDYCARWAAGDLMRVVLYPQTAE
jgi:hypothetical protein